MKTNLYIKYKDIIQSDVLGLLGYNIEVHVLLPLDSPLIASLHKEFIQFGDKIKTHRIPDLSESTYFEHLAFILGSHHTIEPLNCEFILISTDPRVNNLCKYMRADGRKARRLETMKAQNILHSLHLLEYQSKPTVVHDYDEEMILGNLRSIEYDIRPRRIVKLKNHIATVLRCENDIPRIERVVGLLIDSHSISITENKVTYNF